MTRAREGERGRGNRSPRRRGAPAVGRVRPPPTWSRGRPRVRGRAAAGRSPRGTWCRASSGAWATTSRRSLPYTPCSSCSISPWKTASGVRSTCDESAKKARSRLMTSRSCSTRVANASRSSRASRLPSRDAGTASWKPLAAVVRTSSARSFSGRASRIESQTVPTTATLIPRRPAMMTSTARLWMASSTSGMGLATMM